MIPEILCQNLRIPPLLHFQSLKKEAAAKAGYMANYEGFRRDSNLSPGVLGTPPPATVLPTGPGMHNMPPLNALRQAGNNGKGRLPMNVNMEGFYQQHHQGQASPYYAGNKAGVAGMPVHNQMLGNEYYGKYEIEFNHHHQAQLKVPPPSNNNSMDGPTTPFNHHHHHPHPHGNLVQQQIHGLPVKHPDFVNHPAQHKMLNEFGNKGQFNNQAGYYNSQNQHTLETSGPEGHGHGHGSHQLTYSQQQQQNLQQSQFHQNYHLHNHSYEGAVDPVYYHHHHHHPGHHHNPGTGPGQVNKANNFYEANNNSIGYQHEYPGNEMNFPNHHANSGGGGGPVAVPGQAAIAGGGPGVVEGPAPNPHQNVYVQQQQQHQFGFEGGHNFAHGQPHPGQQQQPQYPGGQGEETVEPRVF